MGSPIAAEILGRAGFDWLLVDMEHGPGDMTTLTAQLQAMSGTGAVPLVRAPWNDAVAIKRILDAGAEGVMIPAISTAQEALAAVRACKYPPEGVRGIATGTRAAGYGQYGRRYFQSANDAVLVIVQIETQQSIENLDEILGVSGIDASIGPMDLAASLGCLGEPGRPEVQHAISRIEEKALIAGKAIGTVAGNWPDAKVLYDRGYQLVTLISDGIAIASTGRALVQNFRSEKWGIRNSP